MDLTAAVWDDWLFLAVQLVGVVALVVYVWKTWQMALATTRAAEAAEQTLREAREARIEELAPAILVYFDSSPWGAAEVVIENAGRGAAASVSLVFDPPLQSTQPHETDAFFSATQALMPPGYRIAQMFDTWPTLLSSDMPKKYVVTARYLGVQTGRSYETHHRLDAEALRHRFIGRNKGINEIVEEIEKLRKAAGDHWRQVGNQQQELMFTGPLPAASPTSGQEAVEFLIGYWRLQRVLKDTPGLFLAHRPVVHAIRQMATDVSRFVPAARFTSSQREALRRVAIAAYSRDAEIMGGGAAWWKQIDDAIAALEGTFKRL